MAIEEVDIEGVGTAKQLAPLFFLLILFQLAATAVHERRRIARGGTEREREANERRNGEAEREKQKKKKNKLELRLFPHLFPSLSPSLCLSLLSYKMNLAGAARRPLLAAPLAALRIKPAQRAPLVVRATASPKGHAERATTASKTGTASTPLATPTSPHQLQSGAATSAAQLPFTTALFVRALPGERSF